MINVRFFWARLLRPSNILTVLCLTLLAPAALSSNYRVLSDDGTRDIELQVSEAYVNIHCEDPNFGRGGISSELTIDGEVFPMQRGRNMLKGRCQLFSDDTKSTARIAEMIESSDSFALVIRRDDGAYTYSFKGNGLQTLHRGYYVDIDSIPDETQKQQPVKQPTPVALPPKKTTAEHVASLPEALREIELIEIDPAIKIAGERKFGARNNFLLENCMIAAYPYIRSYSYWRDFDSAAKSANDSIKLAKTGYTVVTRTNASEQCGDADFVENAGGGTYFGKNAIKGLCQLASLNGRQQYDRTTTDLPDICVDTAYYAANKEKSCLASFDRTNPKTEKSKQEYCKCSGERMALYVGGGQAYLTSQVLVPMAMAAAEYCLNDSSQTWAESERRWLGLDAAPIQKKPTKAASPSKNTQKPTAHSTTKPVAQPVSASTTEPEQTSTKLDDAVNDIENAVEKTTEKAGEKISEGMNKLKGLFGK